nr:flagellin [Clostridium sp.]
MDASKEITSKARSRYGALQNVLENSYDRLEDNEITMTKAMSQVGDSDIALEMIELTKSQLLTNTSLLKLKETSEFLREVLNILSNMK